MKSLFLKSLSKKNGKMIFVSFIVFAVTLGFLFYEGSKKTVAITLNGQEKVVKTHADTVAELLKEQNIVMTGHDQISPNLKTPLKRNMKIGFKPAVQLTLINGGKRLLVWSTSTTVADFLSQQGIKLNKLDRVEPSLTERVSENGVINVIRVEKVTDVVEEPVEYAVVTKKDNRLEKGRQRIVNAGQKGLISKRYEVLIENGKEKSRKLLRQVKLKEKQDKIVAVGTKHPALQVSRGAAEKGIEIYVHSTAYTASCGGCSGHTATGINLRANPNLKLIAVDPRIIPLGTKVYVEGYGYAVAADTGSAIKGYKIDVFMPTKAAAYRWGVRKVKIKVLK
jgi:uncharacterized protein YabE (DUF348 family)